MEPQPISAALSFGDAMAALFTKVIPSDPQRMAAFQARYPALYMRVHIHLVTQLFHTLRHWKQYSPEEINDWVNLTCGDLTDLEKGEIEFILNEKLNCKT